MSEDDDPSVRRLIEHYWSWVISPFSKLSSETRAAITTFIAVVSLASQLLNWSLPSSYLRVPSLSSGTVLMGVFGIVAVQTWYHRRRFNRIEDEILDMSAPGEAATDGGNDAVDSLLLFVSGLFLGGAVGEWLAPEYTLTFALFDAGAMMYILGE